MKIYFAGSIAGGREDAEIYRGIVRHLKSYGEVLTEHVANPNLKRTGERLSDKEIHDRDLKWLVESNVVVSEVSLPSLGVGYELARARQLGKRTLCLYRPQEGKRLSGMIAGCVDFDVREYTNIEEAKEAIDNFLSEFYRR